MAANTLPIFSLTPKVMSVRLTGAGNLNTDRTGAAGTWTTLFTAGINGSRVDQIRVIASGTLAVTTAGMIRICHKRWNGSTYDANNLWWEIPVTAVTPSASAVGFNNISSAVISNGFILGPQDQLTVASHILDSAGNQFTIFAQGGDF